jgi:hypothetical protein
MGREVKRVSLDFDWPIGMIWPGYMTSFCSNLEYVVKGKKDVDMCKVCSHFRKLTEPDYEEDGEYNCPDYSIPVPKGNGYQLWETTSEGSPVSPVFETPEELARWLADNNASSFGSQTESYETWLKFIKGPAWAPSMVRDSEGLRSGVKG